MFQDVQILDARPYILRLVWPCPIDVKVQEQRQNIWDLFNVSFQLRCFLASLALFNVSFQLRCFLTSLATGDRLVEHQTLVSSNLRQTNTEVLKITEENLLPVRLSNTVGR